MYQINTRKEVLLVTSRVKTMTPVEMETVVFQHQSLKLLANL